MRGRIWLATVLPAAALVAAGCSPLVRDVHSLASDAMGGRDNGTEGSALARDYIIDRVDDFAVGLDPSRPGAEAFTQPFAGGTNIVALIPGATLPDEYVIIGAHYDHIGTSCRSADAADDICNGATDNATGAAAVLSIGEKLARQRGGPERSVILALWDREEDGLLGARHYLANPLVPVAQTVAYINFDIQGANILPSLRSTTFAIGAETGGDALEAAVERAVGRLGRLETHQLSWIFGQGRSDYLPFIQARVPTVFFSDATGPCYHTAQDEVGVVDFRKLRHQVRNAHRLARTLAAGETTPSFAPGTPLATYDDALALQAVADRAMSDLDRFAPAQQDQLLAFRATLDEIVAAGPDAFGADDISTVLGGAASAVEIFSSGECDGFLRPSRR
ncbi:MAG: M28 family metallopeptidase [Acidimicrobiales bacterium]